MRESLRISVLSLATIFVFSACADEKPSQHKVLCGDTQCTADQKCENDKCVPKAPVTPTPGDCDPECTDGKVCQNGECVDAGSAPDPDIKPCTPECGEGKTCIEGECKAITCPTGEELCGNGCYNLKTDINNCGECGNACGDKTCYNGECRYVCDNGLATCETGCSDLSSDEKNCGKCGKTCETGQSCRNSACTVSCSTGETVCNGACINLDTDTQNCGECGHACAENEICQNKTCKLACDAGKDPCGQTCVDLDRDTANCGKCGNACDTQNNEICYNRKCKAVCRETEALCDGKCVDLKSDKANCGECGHACESGEKCNAGVCDKDCGEGLVDCGGNCIDPKSSADFCGAVNKCDGNDAGQKCGDGFSCKSGTCACTDEKASQCLVNNILICTDPNTDDTHCGCGPDHAGMNCSALNGTATSTCNSGTCTFTCLDNFKDCDDDASNGCEADLTTLDNCGACNHACADDNADKAMCIAGACTYECKSGTTLCDEHCLDLSADDNNCGACGNKCGEDAQCQNSFCTIPLNKCVNGYVTLKVGDKSINAFCLRNELELEAVRNHINAGNKYPDNNTDNAYILMKDLNLGTKDWSPIGTASHAFTGIFLGNGKSITGNLTTQGSNAGLFGVTSGAYLENLNLEIDLTAKLRNIQHIGALVGYAMNNTEIRHCKETGSLSDPDNVGIGIWTAMGGLVGRLDKSSLIDSSAHTDITLYSIAVIGGLIGGFDHSTVENCNVHTTIKTAQTSYFLGGVGGLSGAGNGTVINSSSSGTIDLSNHTLVGTSSNGPWAIGGLLGGNWTDVNKTDPTLSISHSYSTVDINAPQMAYVGGFIGWYNNIVLIDHFTSNSYATGEIVCNQNCGGFAGAANKVTLSNSHATGKVTGNLYTGGLIGATYQTKITDSYATGEVTSPGGYVGGLVGYFFGNSSAENVYATGNVTSTGVTDYTGGAFGAFYDSTVNNVYAKGNTTGCHEYGGLIGEVRRGIINNCAAFGNAIPNDTEGCTSWSAAGLIGDIWDPGITTMTNCVATGNVSGKPASGSAVGYISRSTATLRNVFGTGLVTGTEPRNSAFIGQYDNSNTNCGVCSGGSLAIKNSYYWINASKVGVVGGNTPDEPSIYGMIYNNDKRAVLEDDPSISLVSALGEDWTEVTCKLSSGPGTEEPEEYRIPVPKVFGASICK